MTENLMWVQVAAAVAQVLATIAIGGFALATWKATQRYAKVEGLRLLAEVIRLHGGGVTAPHKLYGELFEILRKEFPRECKELEAFAPKVVPKS